MTSASNVDARGGARERRPWRQSALVLLAVGAAGLATVAFDFRFQLRNGGRLLLGDRYDGMIGTAILEHWYNVVRGLEPWSTTLYFHPTPRTLGYNDGYLLFGLVHAAWRTLGADTFLSAELVNATVRVVGFVAFYAMGRRVFALPVIWAVFAAMLFTLANNLFANAHHAQLFSVCLVPVMALLVHRTVGAFWGRRNASLLAWGTGSAAFLSAWLLTGFYMAWFFAYYLLVLGAVLACFVRRPFVHELGSRVRSARLPLAWLVVITGIALAPFAWLYLPKAAETGMHAYSVARAFLPTPLDLFDVGVGNLVWGPVVDAVDIALGARGFAKGESLTGFPPVLACAFLVCVAWLVVRRRDDARGVPRVVVAMGLAVVVTVLLTLRFGSFSGWWLVYHVVPGAGAVRAVIRYPIFLAAPVAIVVAWTLAQLPLRWRPLVAVLGGLLVVEQVNTLPPLGLDRFAELGRLAAIGRPPPACKVFVATSARTGALYGPAVDARYSHNVDAMIVAETVGVPTLNGFASFSPPYWDLADPDAPSYRARVAEHVARLRVPPPCELDLARSRWRTP